MPRPVLIVSQADRLAALGYLKMGNPLREPIRPTDRPQKTQLPMSEWVPVDSTGRASLIPPTFLEVSDGRDGDRVVDRDRSERGRVHTDEVQGKRLGEFAE